MSTEMQEYALPSKTKSSFGQRINITLEKQYQMCWIEQQHTDYNLYQGIDLTNSRWVHIYIKQKKGNTCPLSKNVRQAQRNQICPKLIVASEADIGKVRYGYEVHQKYGPSMESMSERVKGRIGGKELLHLLLEMLRLVQKLDSLKLVSGELTTKNIVFDPSPKRNQLYLLNCFSFKKRQQDRKSIHSRYCSRGAHLGRTITIKDDLESVCYILIDIFTQGAFLKEKLPHEYKEQKLSLKIEQFAEGLPDPFIDFYHYVISLNYADDINYFYWKNHLTKILSPDVIARPYRFLSSNTATHFIVPSKHDVEDLMETLQYEGNEQLENKLNKVERSMATNQKFKSWFQ